MADPDSQPPDAQELFSPVPSPPIKERADDRLIEVNQSTFAPFSRPFQTHARQRLPSKSRGM
jgi:hypothetical protein